MSKAVMADKGILCKLCGERHPGGVHVAKQAAFIPSPYDEAATFTPDIWERVPGQERVAWLVISQPVVVSPVVSPLTDGVFLTKQERWRRQNLGKMKLRHTEYMREYRAKKAKQATSP